MRRILLALAVAALVAAMMVSAGPAMADDDDHLNRFGVGVLDDNDLRDDDDFLDDDDEEVDIERERFGNVVCLLVIEEDGDEEELEDVFCFPRRGAFV